MSSFLFLLLQYKGTKCWTLGLRASQRVEDVRPNLEFIQQCHLMLEWICANKNTMDRPRSKFCPRCCMMPGAE